MSAEKSKYPRTYHLPWSPGATDDDKTHDLRTVREMFEGREVVITEKLDGENTAVYPDGATHARSLDSAAHPSRDWMRGRARELASLGIPEGFRLSGENLYARHSIAYDRLPSYFVLFGIFDGTGAALSWDEVEEWSLLLDVPTAPVLYRGEWNERLIRELYPFPSRFSEEGTAEGYVVRTAAGFGPGTFDRHVAKFVRPNHVTTDQHWMTAAVVPNRLAPRG